MKKYFLLLAAIQILTLQTLSASHSFYIGTTVGIGALSGKRGDIVTNKPVGVPVTAALTNKKGIHSQRVYGGIFAGHLFRIENFGVGPEFFYNYCNFEDTAAGQHDDPANAVNAFDIKHTITSQFGANARLGYFLDNYFLYTLFGFHSQTGQFCAKAKQEQGAGGIIYEFDYKTERKVTTAFSFGLGLQKAITENYAIGFECKFARFPKRNFTFNLNDPSNTKLTSTLQYKLRSFGLRFMYTF